MKNWVKITLYTVLILAVIIVVRLMFWNNKPVPKAQIDTQAPKIEENANENANELEIETNTFEEDVMKDLEWFFDNSNGYENVEWEYWFTNPED